METDGQKLLQCYNDNLSYCRTIPNSIQNVSRILGYRYFYDISDMYVLSGLDQA